MFNVSFVAHKQYGHTIRAFDANYLLLYVLDVLEGLMARDGVDHDEALSILDVEIAHRCKLFRARRVQYLEDARTAVHFDLFPVEIFNGWIVLFHEGTGHELNRQGRLAHASTAQNDNFVFSHGSSDDGDDDG